MNLKFTRDFDFFRGSDAQPFLSFEQGEVIEVICDTSEDPHNYSGKVFSLGGTTLRKPVSETNFWVSAKNGITVWTSIGMLMDAGILQEIK